MGALADDDDEFGMIDLAEPVSAPLKDGDDKDENIVQHADTFLQRTKTQVSESR